jgi:hypothetical protein
VFLAGLHVPDTLLLELARCLRAQGHADTATTIEESRDAEREFVPLTSVDREAIFHALEECSYGLADLRGVLAMEHAWRDSSLVGGGSRAA